MICDILTKLDQANGIIVSLGVLLSTSQGELPAQEQLGNALLSASSQIAEALKDISGILG